MTDGAPNVEQTRTTITNAYEVALKECGVDRESGDIWQEYITFLRESKVSSREVWLERDSADLGLSQRTLGRNSNRWML